MKEIESLFSGLSRTQKVEFISKNVEMASAVSVAKYVKAYLFDVLGDVDSEYIATYLRGKGYDVKKK